MSCDGNQNIEILVSPPPACSNEPSCNGLYTNLWENNCCRSCPTGNISVGFEHNVLRVEEEKDISFFKPARASSRGLGLASNGHFGVDGNNQTLVQTSVTDNPWWEVDLLGVFDITTLDIRGLVSNQNYKVLISTTPYMGYDYNIAATSANQELSISTDGTYSVNNTGRFIRIYALGNTSLVFNEVQVFGKSNENTSTFRYQWNNPAIGNSNAPECLGSGTHNVTITDELTGCQLFESITID